MTNFGGSGIREDMYSYVRENFQEGQTIVELGAGHVSTKVFSQHYKLYSVEDKQQYLNIYNSNYIYAPLENGWYKIEAIQKGLMDVGYDLIIVDGPTGEGNRTGFLDNIKIFDTTKTIIMDDIHRNAELKLAKEVGKFLNREVKIRDSFAII